jgi:exopolysaccharide biosynthesis polyprenyl glycosylphosphotransferase
MSKPDLHKIILCIQDLITIAIVYFIINYWFSVIYIKDYFFVNYLIISVSTIIIFKVNHLYKYQILLNTAKQTIEITRSLFFIFIFFILVSFVFKQTNVLNNRLYFAALFLSLYFSFIIARVFLDSIIYKFLIKRRIVTKNLLIVGAGEYGKKKMLLLSKSKSNYFNLIGFLDDDKNKLGIKIYDYPVLGRIEDMPEIARKYDIKHILIAIENVRDDRLNKIVEICRHNTNAYLYVVSKHYKIVSEKMSVEEFSDLAAFRIKPSNRMYPKNFFVVKRVLDVVISLFLILALFPIWLIVSVLVKLSSPGPILYKTEVIGKNGNKFFWYKFRSMYHNNDKSVHEKHLKDIVKNGKKGQKLVEDSRITPFGKLIRMFSIDEFPQLLCIIRGDMSLVGPRPCSPYEYSLMNEWQRKRFKIMPGITCLWQIYGRNEVKFNEQIALDMYYIEHRSLLLDVEILLKTIPIVIFGINGK